MKCKKCGISLEIRPLHRTNELGNDDPCWTCQPCIEIHHPKLVSDVLVLRHLTSIFYT